MYVCTSSSCSWVSKVRLQEDETSCSVLEENDCSRRINIVCSNDRIGAPYRVKVWQGGILIGLYNWGRPYWGLNILSTLNRIPCASYAQESPSPRLACSELSGICHVYTGAVGMNTIFVMSTQGLLEWTHTQVRIVADIAHFPPLMHGPPPMHGFIMQQYKLCKHHTQLSCTLVTWVWKWVWCGCGVGVVWVW